MSARHFNLSKLQEALTSLDEATEVIDPKTWGKKLWNALDGYSLSVPEHNAGLKLYRAVPVDAQPKKITRIKYRHAEEITTWGRLNSPGESVFYCCSAYEATFFEVKPKQGDLIVIGTWETTQPLSVPHVGYSEKAFKNFGWHRKTLYDVSSTPDIQEANDLLAQRFANPLDTQEFYRKTVAIKHCFWRNATSSITGVQSAHSLGLMYPSIACKANHDNFGLPPEYVDNNLKLLEATLCRIEDVDFQNLKIPVTYLDFATTFGPGGEIEWKGRLPQWVMKEAGSVLNFTVENGQWVARDSKGNIVEPN